MRAQFIEKEFAYDGSQLRPLYAYLHHGVMGDSIVSWKGPCNIAWENMKDGEDLLEASAIRSDQMLHFIIEIFHQSLLSGVACQRLFASVAKDYLQRIAAPVLGADSLDRFGDDIYWNDKKLSISIASSSSVSTQIHFAMNITTEGTPVKTTSLQELGMDPQKTAEDIMVLWSKEFESMQMATQKVIPL